MWRIEFCRHGSDVTYGSFSHEPLPDDAEADVLRGEGRRPEAARRVRPGTCVPGNPSPARRSGCDPDRCAIASSSDPPERRPDRPSLQGLLVGGWDSNPHGPRPAASRPPCLPFHHRRAALRTPSAVYSGAGPATKASSSSISPRRGDQDSPRRIDIPVRARHPVKAPDGPVRSRSQTRPAAISQSFHSALIEGVEPLQRARAEVDRARTPPRRYRGLAEAAGRPPTLDGANARVISKSLCRRERG